MKPRLGESAEEIYNWIKGNYRQIRFNTLGEGYYFIDLNFKLNRMEGICCREATNNEFNNLWKWLERDMIQVEERRGLKWIVIHSPSGLSFNNS